MNSQTIKALTVTPSTGDLAIRDIPMPDFEADEILVRITRVGLTRRDRLILQNPNTAIPDGSDYLIPGHIAIGKIVEKGSLVKEFDLGDLVVPTIRRDCKKCIDLRSDLCPHPDKYMDSGLMRTHGFAREFIAIKGRYLVKIPKDLEEVALLVAPLSVAEKAHSEAVEILQRYNFYCYYNDESFSPHTLVTGMGPVGIMTAFLLSLYNYRLTVFGRRESDDLRSRLFESMDAEYLNAARVPMERLENAGYSFNHIFDTTGDPSFILRTIPFMAYNGIMVLMAMPENVSQNSEISIDAGHLFSRMVAGNQVIIGSIKSGKDAFESSVKHLTELNDLFGQELLSLITHVYSLEDYQKVLALDSRETILPAIDLT